MSIRARTGSARHDPAAEHRRRRSARAAGLAFNELYSPMRAFARVVHRGRHPSALGRRGRVDEVADAIYALAEAARPASTYNLTANSNASTIGEIVSSPAATSGAHPRRCLRRGARACSSATSASQRSAPGGSQLLPVLRDRNAVRRGARARAARSGRDPSTRRYMTTSYCLLDFATRSRWGKRLIARAPSASDLRPRVRASLPQPGGFGVGVRRRSLSSPIPNRGEVPIRRLGALSRGRPEELVSSPALACPVLVRRSSRSTGAANAAGRSVGRRACRRCEQTWKRFVTQQQAPRLGLTELRAVSGRE